MIVSLAIHPELRKKHVPRHYLNISNACNLPRKSPGPSQTHYSRVSPCAVNVSTLCLLCSWLWLTWPSTHATTFYQSPITGGEGAWKPMKTSWVHCRLWLNVPTTYLPITDWVHSKCSCRFQVEHMIWVHLCNILNVILTCAIHFIPHNS